MFAKTADAITKKLKENNSISSEQYEICRFGFQQGLTILLNAVTVIVIGAVMKELWQAILFMILYAPLRSNAGGYHARTATRCYIYSIFLMIAVLLAMKYLYIPTFICIIALLISFSVIVTLAPVEDPNKPLDEMEHAVYKRRTLIINISEGLLLIISIMLCWKQVAYCITLEQIFMSLILLLGKCKNKFIRKSTDIHM